MFLYFISGTKFFKNIESQFFELLGSSHCIDLPTYFKRILTFQQFRETHKVISVKKNLIGARESMVTRV